MKLKTHALVFGLGIGLAATASHASPIDFEDLALGTIYNVPAAFVTGGTNVTTSDFTWFNGVTTSSGFAQVNNSGFAGGAGQDMQLNNVLLNFDIVGSDLDLDFGEFGGNLNIIVNGDFVNFGNFADINGAVIGGAAVSVTNGLGNDQGKLSLTGAINGFSIGGQELWIDNVSYVAAVPIPASALLLLGGLASCGVFARKRRA